MTQKKQAGRPARRNADKAAALDDWSPELLKSRVYGQMLVDIILGQLAPGERLDEELLTRRYECGLAGVREALARLALEGLVQRRSRVGTSVAPLDLLEAKEAFEARKLIETHCAGLAAQYATQVEIDAIKASFDQADEAVAKNDVRALTLMDRAFHVAVASASHNRTLAKMVVTLHHRAARFWLYAMAPPPAHGGADALARHRAVGDAIESRDPASARDAMMKVLDDFPQDVSTIAAGGAPRGP